MQIVIAAVARDDERRRPVRRDGLFDALIVMHVTGQNQIGNAPGIANGVFQHIRHLGASAVEDVERVDRVMQRENQRPIGRGGREFVGDPLLLNGIDRSALGHVGIEADDGRERRHQRPVDVRKIELDPRRVFRDRVNVGMGLHEILHPAVERGLRGGIVDLAVMVAGNRQDRHVVMRVRLVELRRNSRPSCR